MKLDEMDDEERLKHLGARHPATHQQVRRTAAEKKTGIKVEAPKRSPGQERRAVEDKTAKIDVPVYPKEFREAQQRVCSDAFLAMRSRHDQDFVEFFAGSICSVAQLPDAKPTTSSSSSVLMTNARPATRWAETASPGRTSRPSP